MAIYTDYAKNRYTDFITADDLEDMFDTEMTDLYGMVNVMGYDFYQIDVLREKDPIAYRQAFLDWIDARGYEEVKDADGKMVGYADDSMLADDEEESEE